MDDIKAQNVAKVDEDKGLLVLILNIFFPGVGTMLAGKTWGDHPNTFTIGIIQFVLFLVGILLSWTAILFICYAIGWIWAIWWGVLIMNKSKA